jgi:SH3-like domain-containing protein
MYNIRTLLVAVTIALASLGGAGTASAQVVEGEEHCVVNVRASDALNVRERGRVGSRIVTTLNYGECGVIVTGACQGSWCPIEDGHHAGWVHSHYISMVSPAMYCVTGVRPGDILNLRAYPSPQSRILAELPRRQCNISFLPYATNGWQKVRVQGYEGWVNRRYLSGQ